jgi:DNA polymerase elongation subunit (family B)
VGGFFVYFSRNIYIVVYMIGFYTSIVHKGNSLLYRGYNENGKRIQERIPFKPTYYLEAKTTNTKYRGLDGLAVEPMTFPSIKDATEFESLYKGISDFKIYGNPRHVPAFIQSQFPSEITFKRSLVNVGSFDIETAYGEGFPTPENPINAVLTIAYKSSKEDFYRVWGVKPYDEKECTLGVKVVYKQFANEESMLNNFIEYWSDPENTPDVITGWNTEFFDVPYLLARVEHLLGASMMRKFSPWNNVWTRYTKVYGRDQRITIIDGIPNLDYMALFKKFAYSYGNQESYRLDHIASVVLNERKLDYSEAGSLKNLYDSDFQKYIDYNIKDVELIERFEEKLGLITLVMTTAYIGGVNYADTLGTTAIWDAIIYRRLMRKRTVPPLRQLPASNYVPYGATVGSITPSNPSANRNTRADAPIAGGYVKDVREGMSEWVMSFDLNSLYPNIIIQNNMSPETLVKQSFLKDVFPNRILAEDKFPGDIDLAKAANGSVYRKDIKGIIPELVEELYAKRVEMKNKMIQGQKALEKDTKNQALIKDVARHETMQWAVKILLNSLYGALANKYFRYYDPQIAEGVTLTGQTVIQWAEKAVNQKISEFLKEDEIQDRVIAIDTDSVYITASDIINKFAPKDPVKFLDEFGNRVIEVALSESFDRYAKISNAYSNRMVMKREAIADRGIWTAKKRYILNVHNNEGVQYAEPKIKMMGIEAIKSSTPQACRVAMKEIFKVIMTGSESQTREAIALFKSHFKKLRPEEIAFPRGVSDIIHYADKNTIYTKGTPINSRAAILYNHYIKKHRLENEYELINNGDKIKFLYLKLPNPIRENIFGFKDAWPEPLEYDKYIDYELQFLKTFTDPLDIILQSLGWTAKATLFQDAIPEKKQRIKKETYVAATADMEQFFF